MTKTAATIGQAGGTGARGAGDGAAAEFERLYRANVEAVTSYFARRSADPHVVADLTAATAATAPGQALGHKREQRPAPVPRGPGRAGVA